MGDTDALNPLGLVLADQPGRQDEAEHPCPGRAARADQDGCRPAAVGTAPGGLDLRPRRAPAGASPRRLSRRLFNELRRAPHRSGPSCA